MPRRSRGVGRAPVSPRLSLLGEQSGQGDGEAVPLDGVLAVEYGEPTRAFVVQVVEGKGSDGLERPARESSLFQFSRVNDGTRKPEFMCWGVEGGGS